MNVDEILATMNRHGCQFLLIGGMNFMLRHQPILTYDVDLWIEDTADNRRRCELALTELNAQWGATDKSWGPVATLPAGWLDAQFVYCLTCPQGALDIFRQVAGLDNWQACWSKSVLESTAANIEYRGLSDDDMLRCQMALAEGLQKPERIRVLREAIEQRRQP